MQFTSDGSIKFQSYVSKPIPNTSLREAMYIPYILTMKHVHPVHPSEELCIPCPSFREAMYSKGYFHHLTCVTYKHAVHMR